MSKSEVMERRRQLIAESRREEERRETARMVAQNRQYQRSSPVIVLREDGAWLSLEWIRDKIFGGSRAPAGFFESLPRRVIAHATGDRTVVEARDLEQALDAGRAGIGPMGCLEVFSIRALADLLSDDLRVLDVREFYGAGEARAGGLRSWFERARADHLTRAEERWAWGKQRGPAAFRNVEELLADHGLEVGFDRRRDTILWIRALPADPQAAGEDADASARLAVHPGLPVPEGTGAAEPGAPILSHDPVESMEPGPARRHARASRQVRAASGAEDPKPFRAPLADDLDDEDDAA
jgi:hypothetical protein